MKRAFLLFLCAVIIVSACGCKKDTPQLEAPANFYYCTKDVSYNSSSGVICPEMRETAMYQGDIAQMLRDYLSGPISQDLVCPFPPNTQLLSVSLTDGQLYILLNEEFSTLSGVDLSTACSCITLTVSQYTEVAAVTFQCENGQLENKETITIYPDDIILMDDEI